MSNNPLETRETQPDRTAPPSRSPTFTTGQLIAERFRIVRFIAAGGMGELYKAEDRELHEHVALKTIKPEIAQDEWAIARFKREAFLARQVTHPNICRIFDLFHHRPPAVEGSPPAPAIAFVTMQLLAGETLADRLRRERMTADEALPVVTQMALALDAAHQAGVVHRDFKSNNVMLVPQRDGPPRAVITDFGLALRPGEGAGGRHVHATMTGQILGTPDYMAPEQVEGGELTPATDVYALGLVIYEMVTGERPFAAPTPLAAAVRRLSESPRPPRELAPDLDPVWESAILRCLERLPRNRFARAGEVLAALQPGAPAATPAEIGEESQRSRLLIAAALVAVVIVALGLYAWRAGRPSPGSTSRMADTAQGPPRRSIAVLGFKNVSGRPDAAWLSTAFAEMLTTELAAGEQLRTIPGENVARMKIELALADADAYAPDTLARISENLDADLVVFGSYVAVGEPGAGTIRLDARLQDSREGETIALVSETSPEADVLDLVSRTGVRLRERLDIDALAPAVAAEVRASQPASVEAARLYAEGLAQLRRFDALAARDLLERAVEVDARFPLAHSALAMTWATLGYDERARSAASRAFKLSSGLSREERLSVEGAYRETAREWKQAIEIYETLFRFFPDNLEYGLRLADAQISSGASKEALGVIESLRQSKSASDPRIDLADAAAAEMVSDFKRMRTAASAAAARGQAQGARLIVARARLLEGTAVLRLGEPERAISLYEAARAAYAEAGDRGGVARALNDLASAFSDRDVARGVKMYEEALAIARANGHQQMVARLLNNMAIMKRRSSDLDGALTLNREALAIRREIGDRANLAVSLNNIGNILLDLGDLAGATAHYNEAAGIHREIGDRRGLARARNNEAVALKMQGQLTRARAANDEALAIRREIADPGSVAISLFNIGELMSLQGELAKAVQTFEEALALQRKLDIARGVGYSLYGLGSVALMQGDTATARKRLEESLEVRTKLGEKATAAETLIELANVALADGRAADAVGLAQDAVGFYAGHDTPDGQAVARAMLARAMLAAGRAPAALTEADRAQGLVGKTQNVVAKLAVTIAAARIQAIARPAKAAAATALLESAAAQAATLGLLPQGFDAALALAEVAARTDRTAVDTRLLALEKDARSHGFGLVASRAAATRKTPSK